jgi:hypothetical protein
MTGHFRRDGSAGGWGKALAGMACLLLLAGCGNKPKPPPLVTVKGKIVCRGKPMPAVLIKFWPRQANAQRRPVDTVSGPQGEFSLSCPTGTYRVTVMNIPVSSAGPGLAQGPGGVGSLERPAVIVPAIYGDRVDTPLTVEVPEGGTDQVVITVDP